ncbi:4-phosphoerythronate dehydrogenase [Haliea sp. E17]|uniref:4-phosphoerythronate dehydrogenase n=1 Tax=Haliea sp. E17 TaxID=3401576 RepID=UPI003AABDFBC
MKPRVLVDENIPGAEAYLGNFAEITRAPGRQIAREQLLQADALLVRSVTRVDAALLAGTPVRFVGTATSGFDHIDREWLAAQGIGFCHAPGSNANSVVEYLLAAIAENGDFLERLLAGARIGIVGYGHIGQAVVRRLQHLAIDYCVCDPWLEAGAVPNCASLDDVLACSVVSLHPSLVRAQPWPSYHLLGASELAQLQSGQLLVNASRGPVVDNRDLLARLQQPDAPAVVLDVWEPEPQLDPELLAGVDLGTAHIAGYSLDGKLLATGMLATALAQTLGLDVPAPRAPDPGPLFLAAPGSPADALRQLLAQRYRVADDDRRLRDAVLGAPAEQAARNFDLLRKHYPERRELAGSVVNLDTGAESHAGLVRALGAIPREAS